MGSKIFIFMCLSFAFMLHISAGVAARDLVETTTDHKTGSFGADTNAKENPKIIECEDGCGNNNNGGSRGGDGGGGGGGSGGGNIGGGSGGNSGGTKGGDNCRYGCCGGDNYYGIGCKCCSYAGEAFETRDKPHN